MTINDPLDLQVSLADQQLASRLGLASIDNDSDRYRQALAEIVAGGMPTALAVISVLNQLLASGMATSMGVEASRAQDCKSFAAQFESAMRGRGPRLIEAVI